MEYEILDELTFFVEEVIVEQLSYLVVVMYDITDNKRRLFFSKMLKGYGTWVQRSVFECILTEKKFNHLVREIEKFVLPHDLIRVYRLAGNTTVKVWGPVGFTEEDDIIII
jgi:CRISPR-associated protein Cas2